VTTEAPRRRRSQAQRSAETRVRLLDATLECLVTYGYAGTTTPRVAKVAGLTRGAQVHHFGSKNDLMIAAVQHLAATRTASAIPRFSGRMEKAEDPLDAILEIAWDIHTEVLFIPVAELWIAGRTDPALRGEVSKLESIVLTTLIAAVANFVPEAVHRPLLEFMYLAMDVLRGILISSMTDPDWSRARRRWDRARPGLRRAADPTVIDWALRGQVLNSN
jgi:AcrR family transcriptional regulator